MKRPSAIQLVLSLSIIAAAGAAHAQYVWLNDHGVKQYSDMPPPANVPKQHILKDPSVGTLSPYQTSDADNSNDSAAQSDESSQQPLSIAEKNADFMKRRADQEEQQKKAAEKAKQAAAKAKDCERARQYSRSLDSGIRIASTDKNGEQSFMGDEQRAKESQETRRQLQNCK